mmetsp:Transcript_973/g.3885  ORF Transcript_973/g.3885 Transcript_973/m.3885 type:complete len:240 (-) Transcript_973:749-1468(-)
MSWTEKRALTKGGLSRKACIWSSSMSIDVSACHATSPIGPKLVSPGAAAEDPSGRRRPPSSCCCEEEGGNPAAAAARSRRSSARSRRFLRRTDWNRRAPYKTASKSDRFCGTARTETWRVAASRMTTTSESTYRNASLCGARRFRKNNNPDGTTGSGTESPHTVSTAPPSVLRRSTSVSASKGRASNTDANDKRARGTNHTWRSRTRRNVATRGGARSPRPPAAPAGGACCCCTSFLSS